MGDIRVLVVDDDFAVAALHRAFVEDHGSFTVVATASTGAEALELVSVHHPELVLLDIYLPDMSGLAVLNEIRSRTDLSVDVIAITAARELDTVRSAMRGGVLHYLVKPFTAAALRERLDDYLRHREMIQRSAREATELDQAQVDRLLNAPGSTLLPTAPLPKGLSQQTMSLVTRSLSATRAPKSSAQIAEAVGMSRVAARRYLEHLVVLRKATVQPRYGRSGRPENLYTWRA